MKPLAFAAALALLPIAAGAASGIDVPASFKLKMTQTNMVRISVFSVRGKVRVTQNNCYSSPAAAHDILRVAYSGTSEGSGGGVMAIDIYPKNPGECKISFADRMDNTGTTAVTVSK
ncbi:MAG TPA: hypothetical protein VIJ12_01570 [Candidatus Baltobacteraceae bacterium]